MSQLSDKILSYNPQVYMDFTQAVTTTPVFNPNTVSPVWSATATSATTRVTRDLTDNPLGGYGCWRWNQPASVTCVAMNSTTIASLNDGEYSTGIWFKLSAFPGGTLDYAIFGSEPRASAASSIRFNIRGSASTSGPSTITITSKGRVNTTGLTFTLNQWHYVAFVKRSDGSADIYLDNVVIRSESGMGATGATSFTVGPHQTSNSTTPFELSFTDFYMSNPGQIDTAQVSEIWTAGSTAPITNNLKYWNGTAWTVPLNKYQWDGINWITLNGKYWNGSTWVNIT